MRCWRVPKRLKLHLKQIIKQKAILNNVIDQWFTLHEEPLIYSIKYDLANRYYPLQFYRNKKLYSILRCLLPSYQSTYIPLVLIVRFYVTPPTHIDIPADKLKAETLPATFGYEICDYLLSLQEMFMHTLINSYKQFVKIDAEKYYSDKPRTQFKFMTWNQYVNIQDYNPIYPEAKKQRAYKRKKKSLVQSLKQRDDQNKELRQATPAGLGDSLDERSTTSDRTLPLPSTIDPKPKKKRTARQYRALEKARRRQSREISERLFERGIVE